MRTGVSVAVFFVLIGCSASNQQQAGSSSANMAAATDFGPSFGSGGVTEGLGFPDDPRLVGRWAGPEGLFADIRANGPGRFMVAMQHTLDQSGTYPARRDGQSLVVERPGGPVRLTYGAGAETGMKWVAPGAHCLIAKVGQEAYCRPGL